MPTLLVLTGDLHTNSTVALCPPTVELDDGGTYRASKPQKWIWARWLEFWDAAADLKKRYNAEAVTLLNGELADDNYHNTTQLISKHKGDQARAALAVVEPVQAVSDRIFVTRGSEAHSGLNASMDESLARAIGAIPNDEGHHARWYFRGVIDGLRVDASHHPGTGHARPWTKGADANRLAQMVMSRYVERELPVPHLVVRGHNHKPSDSGDNHPSRAIILPSWQLSTSFGYRLGGDWLPIGGMLAVVEKGQVIYERKLISRWPIGPWRNA